MGRERYRDFPLTPTNPTVKAANPTSLLRLWGQWLLVSMAISVLMVIPLRSFAPITSAFMLRQHLNDLVEFRQWRPIEHRWIDANQISRHAFNAVLAAEDQRFFQHHGFDLQAMKKAYAHNSQHRNIRGASTISQQVAKNLFLSPARSYVRKGLEMWFTGWLEVFWPKQRILEIYLNIAEFGDHLYGIEAASRHYFGVSAAHLSANQAALLAATLPNPHLLKADKPSVYLLRRQRWILAQMRHFL